ncbi:unnamed protein product [Rotaria magnacalcarata]|uniref:Ceramide kinase C-terminal domain-containing protein n=1 Tax=Rotaria magnacalcarata TaxID=392030 RepID=A0A8S2N5C9_9BILA|nr:unnamed protein product [Rotaria magnacalcarata]
MSSKAQRRRAKSSVTEKQAFEENENENKLNTHAISDGYQSSPMGNIDLDRFYERAFFTINDSTVEVVLNNDILSWSTISSASGETSHEDAHQRQAPNNEYLNSIHLHDVYAISPMYHESHRPLNINENQSDISLSNTTSSLSSSSNLPLRGFQLHSFDKMNENILQEILIIFQNKRMKIDMSAIFDINYNFVTANFSAGAGFPANALQYFTRYSLCSPNKTIRKSFAKAASNKNLRFIEMEIRYIPAKQNSITMTRCHRGCSSCTPPSTEEYDNQVKVFDNTHIQNINKRKMPSLSNNNHSTRSLSASRKSYSQENEEKKQWKTLHGNYLQVAVLTNANLWSFAPQGLSKFGHIADGLLDLVLIESTTRKEFLRYIKRNGNSKNQHELPFTRVIKVKEIEIELKFPNNYLINGISNTNNELDSSSSKDSSNEDYSNNENGGSFTQRHEPHPPNAPISEDSRRYHRHHHHLFGVGQDRNTTMREVNYSCFGRIG